MVATPADIDARLHRFGLRPTRQRHALASLLFGKETDRHVTAEQMHREAQVAGLQISLATVYNTLHEMTRLGMLQQVAVDTEHYYFDTNVDAHHHFYHLETGELEDFHATGVTIQGLPEVPQGVEISRVDVIVRIRGQARIGQ